MRSPGRTRPKTELVIATRLVARRFARAREGVEAEGVVEDAGVDGVGAGGRGRAEAGVEGDEVGLGAAEAEHGGRLGSLGESSMRASRMRSRVSVSIGADSVPGSRARPRRGAALPSLGGSRISTRARVGVGLAVALG